MDTQAPLSPELRLLPRDAQHDWRLDDATREAGRRGIAAARRALADARRRQHHDEADPADARSTAA